MSAYYNQLSPAQLERLAILSEELGEAQQIIGKIIRHGLDSYHPDDRLRVINRTLLAKEIGHVDFAVDMLILAGDLDEGVIFQSHGLKAENIKPWLRHQEGASK